jgi:hypothetical protein
MHVVTKDHKTVVTGARSSVEKNQVQMNRRAILLWHGRLLSMHRHFWPVTSGAMLPAAE